MPSIMPHIVLDFWDLGIPHYSHCHKGLDSLHCEPPSSPKSFLCAPWNSCSTMNKLSYIIRLFKHFSLLPDLTETGPSPCKSLQWRLWFVSGVHTWKPEVELVISWFFSEVPKLSDSSLLQNPTPLLFWKLCHLTTHPHLLPTATACSGHRCRSPSFLGDFSS